MRNEYTSIFIDRICASVYKYSFRCIVLPQTPSPRAPHRPVRPPRARAHRRRRRHRLHRPGAAAPALAPSVRRARRGDVVGRRPARRRGDCRRWRGCGTASITPLSAETLAADADVVFLALPDSAAAELAPALVDAGVARHRSVRRLPASRGRPARAVVSRNAPAASAASPTVSPSASAAPSRARSWSPTRAATRPRRLLALAPLVDAGRLLARRRHHRRRQVGRVGRGQDAVGADALLRSATAACRRYGVFNHRHGAEIEQGVGRAGHLHAAPGAARPRDSRRRSTSRVAPGTTEEALGDVLEQAYAGATFVRLVGSALPEIKHVAHTNFCDIGWRVDAVAAASILVSVIDNLLKGASGQAVQNMNVMLGLDERAGLL